MLGAAVRRPASIADAATPRRWKSRTPRIRPGDDFRRVDWNAFARLERLNVKLSQPQRNVMLHLQVDRSTSMEFGSPSKAHLAMQIAACLAYLALTQLDGVRVYGVHGAHLARSPRYWGKGQTADALRHVQALEPGTDTDLEGALAAFIAGHPERGLLVVLTDLLSPTEFRVRLRQVVSAGFEVALVHVLSELEVRPGQNASWKWSSALAGQSRRGLPRLRGALRTVALAPANRLRLVLRPASVRTARMTVLAPLGLAFFVAAPAIVLSWLLHARFRSERVPSPPAVAGRAGPCLRRVRGGSRASSGC
jgi:Protein of unknown function DUF58